MRRYCKLAVLIMKYISTVSPENFKWVSDNWDNNGMGLSIEHTTDLGTFYKIFVPNADLHQKWKIKTDNFFTFLSQILGYKSILETEEDARQKKLLEDNRPWWKRKPKVYKSTTMG